MRGIMVFRGCMNSIHKQYPKKEKKKRERKKEKTSQEGEHAPMLKTLNIFINQLHFSSSTLSTIYIRLFLVLIVLGLLI
jgi:hypothetical protein